MSDDFDKRLKAGVEFTPASASTMYFGADLAHYDFNGKRVADLSCADEGLAGAVINLGAEAYVHFAQGAPGAKCPEGGPPIEVRPETFWDYAGPPLDYVFVDAASLPDFDEVSDVFRLTRWLDEHLTETGICFAVLQTGLVQTDWDVFNSLLMTPIGRLPSSPYLYDVMLRKFAVRPLVRIDVGAHAKYAVRRLFRLARRQQTLLLVMGHSQAGKTTLARQLRMNSPNSHLSSDYIFYNLLQHRTADHLPGRGKGLQKILGGGSAEDTGNFFRRVEDDKALLTEYLEVARFLMPKHGHVLSMDMDLRRDERIDFVKKFFTDAGYSVWLVSR